jgi:hypothetical protein
LIRGHASKTLDIGLLDPQRVRKGRGLAAQQRLLCALHALLELVSVAVHILVDRALDQLCLLQARHQRGVADLLLGGLMNLDRGLRSRHRLFRYFGTTHDTTPS